MSLLRWAHSLNYDALLFSIPLVLAETYAYIGLVLFTANLWKTKDYPQRQPSAKLSETLDHPLVEDRPISVDVFFPTYNEEEDLVRLSIRDAKRLEYPFSIDIKIHVLDDGKRKTMQLLADEEGSIISPVTTTQVSRLETQPFSL